jgi:hypothetical protein
MTEAYRKLHSREDHPDSAFAAFPLWHHGAMSKITAASTSTVWRGTWESGGRLMRLTIRLSKIEMMISSSETTYVSSDGAALMNDDGTPKTAAGSWHMRLSSGKEFPSLPEETGNSIHEAWMRHLEHVSTI